jgi:hypothetical protein
MDQPPLMLTAAGSAIWIGGSVLAISSWVLPAM